MRPSRHRAVPAAVVAVAAALGLALTGCGVEPVSDASVVEEPVRTEPARPVLSVDRAPAPAADTATLCADVTTAASEVPADSVPADSDADQERSSAGQDQAGHMANC